MSFHAAGQGLVPLDDRVASPLLPAGIGRDVIELSGQYVYIWTDTDGTQVIQYQGSFELLSGPRRLRSQNAVIWMKRHTWQNNAYYHFEVFLWRDAQVIEPAGTTTSGPALLVTLNSYAAPELRFDAQTMSSSADTDLYRQAVRIRGEVLKRSPISTQPGQMRVMEFGAKPEPQPKVRPLIQFHGDQQLLDQKAGLIVFTGRVYVSQGLIDSAEFLELRSDSAVLFLSPETPATKTVGSTTTQPVAAPAPEVEKAYGPLGMARGQTQMGQQFGRQVTGAYLEGNVLLTRGDRMIRSPRLYYDFENDRALILDAVMRSNVPDRDLPIYVRAQQVRQLSATEFVADKAIISTSEFHTPHVHIGADQITLTDTAPRDVSGNVTGVYAGRYVAENTTLNLEGVPIMYWPYSRGDFQQSENILRSARFGYSSEYGATAQAKWQLFNLAGVQAPEGFDATLRTDYFSERGPGVGVDLDYKTEDYYGLFRGYYIHDQGEDDLGGFRSGKPDTENRGRALWRHRQYLPQGWELTLEASYLSDPNFLESYFEPEFNNDKDQETLAYLKKQKDKWAFTLLTQMRVNDFLTQTEHLPDAAFHLIGEPIGRLGSVFSESHVGLARYMLDDRKYFQRDRADHFSDSDLTFRAVTRNEAEFPLKLGPVNLVPYAAGRIGYWSDSPFEGALSQAFGSVGVRGGTQFWKLDETIQSRILDVHGVRHVVKPEVTAWVSGINKDSFDLTPFDESIENVDGFSGASLALRQRWQTKRGGPGRWRLVDWITLDVEVGAFANRPEYEQEIGHVYSYRPENSIAVNHARADFSYRISDTTAVYSDANYNLDDGHMDKFNVSYAVERTPRFSYFLGYRFIGDTDSNLVGFGANYQINTKHTIAVREYFDLDRGETETFDITIIRKFPRWYVALTLGVANITDDFNIALSMWPEGIPEAALGTKQYTGLTTSTGINAQQKD